MNQEQYDKINELLLSSINHKLDANCIAYINGMIKDGKKEAQKEIVEELYDSLKHDDDEDKTLYLPLTKLGELKDRFSKN